MVRLYAVGSTGTPDQLSWALLQAQTCHLTGALMQIRVISLWCTLQAQLRGLVVAEEQLLLLLLSTAPPVSSGPQDLFG